MNVSRRGLFAASPALLLAGAQEPSQASTPKPAPLRFTSTFRPVTEAENGALHQHLKIQLGEPVHSGWFKDLHFDSLDGNTINATLPNNFLCQWVGSHYLDNLAAACRHILGNRISSIGLAERQHVRTFVPPQDSA